MMQAIILAAGIGKRLGDVTEGLPKCFLNVGGMSILDRQLEALKGMDVTMVVGYKANLIKSKYPHLKFVLNPDYLTTNTIHSLGLALNGKDTFVLNGDVVFDKRIIKLLNKPSCAAVEFKNVHPEEIQVITKDGDGIVRIGKNINGTGEAIGIYRFSGKFCDKLKAQISKMGKMLYYEDAIDKILPMDFHAIDIGDLGAKEIDFKEDLEEAKTLKVQ
jgi:L-glutamine-phosphate cytidylyltransferase